MRLPDFSNSADRLLNEYGLYHLTRLRANPRMMELAALLTAPPQEKIARSGPLLSRLAEEADPALRPCASWLMAALETLGHAVGTFRSALAGRAYAYRRLEEAKRARRATYGRSHERLETLYPTDPRRVAGYFLPPRRGAGGEEPTLEASLPSFSM